MKSNDPAFTDPALAVIRRVDPALAKRIDTAPELITVVTDPDISAREAVPNIGLTAALGLDYSLYIAYGVTQIPRGEHVPMDGDIWVNKPMIENQARELHVPVDQFTAFILAHEFRHHDGGEEPAAYAQGTAFARELNQPTLLQFAENLARKARHRNYGYDS
jgi:hypothetical protein